MYVAPVVSLPAISITTQNVTVALGYDINYIVSICLPFLRFMYVCVHMRKMRWLAMHIIFILIDDQARLSIYPVEWSCRVRQHAVIIKNETIIRKNIVRMNCYWWYEMHLIWNSSIVYLSVGILIIDILYKRQMRSDF